MMYLSKHNQFSPLKLIIIDLKITQHLQGLPVAILARFANLIFVSIAKVGYPLILASTLLLSASVL